MQNKAIEGILNAIELYAEAGRKASRELGQKAFTEAATMSWVEDGKIVTVPINALFDVLEQTGEEEVTYTDEDVTVAGNVAFQGAFAPVARIDLTGLLDVHGAGRDVLVVVVLDNLRCHAVQHRDGAVGRSEVDAEVEGGAFHCCSRWLKV